MYAEKQKESTGSRQSQCRQQLNDVQNQSEMLLKQISELRERLAPVTFAKPQPEPCDKESEKPSLCPVAQELHSAACKLRQAGRGLSDLLSDLEV